MKSKTKPGTNEKKPVKAEPDEDSSVLMQRSIALPDWMWKTIDSYVEKNRKERWRPTVRSRNRFFEELCLEEMDRIKKLEAAETNEDVVARLAVLEQVVRVKQQAS